MSLPHQAVLTPKIKRYEYIDTLRGIAIILVLLAHTELYTTIAHPVLLHNLASLSLGPRGVQLFYVVSAFTLCMSYYKRKTFEKNPLRNFYIRRFFRIAPLFYLALGYYLLQQNNWDIAHNHFSFFNIFTTLTFTNGLSWQWINNIVFGGWSVAVETTFYALFPLLFYMLKNWKRAIIITASAMIAMQILRLYLLTIPEVQHNPDIQTYTYQFFPSQLPVFLIGMSVFFMIKEDVIKKYKKYITFCVIALILFFVTQLLFHSKLIAGHYIYGLIFGMLLSILSKHPYKILVNPFTQYIGKVSFSLYLCHDAVIFWLVKIGMNHMLPANPYLNFLLRFSILFIVSTLVASVFYFTIEKWGISMGKKLIKSLEKSENYHTLPQRLK